MKNIIGLLITVCLMLVLATVVCAASYDVGNVITQVSLAAVEYPATTVCFPKVDGETDPYFVLYDVTTGNLVNASTGTIAASVSWADAAFDEGHFTAHAISGQPVYTIPALGKVKLGILCFNAATPLAADPILRSGLFDPKSGSTYTDMLPVKNGEVRVRETIDD